MVDLEGERKKQSATEKVVENNGKKVLQVKMLTT
jgi:hypothetical protein